MEVTGDKLLGKRALVTAGGQGIGRAIAEQLLRMGARVAVHSFKSPVDVAEWRGKTGCGEAALMGIHGDLRTRAGAQEVVKAALSWHGGLDLLINNAGSIIGRRSMEQLDPEFFAASVALNVESAIWVTQACGDALAASGAATGASVVNLASLAGRKGGHPGSLLYSSMKGALLTWTRSLASEWGPRGVRVNAVAPGLILGSKFHDQHSTRESIEQTIQGIPLGRAGEVGDVARAVVYLASEYDGFITGATLDINGGVYAC